MKAETSRVRQQYGALPLGLRDGRLRVLLVTSRNSGRWIIPKGRPEPGLTPSAVAKREAFEEAGVEGWISTLAVGSFHHAKRLHGGILVRCRIKTYPLWTGRVLRHWPERRQRKRAWFRPDDAAAAVHDGELGELIGRFCDDRAAIEASFMEELPPRQRKRDGGKAAGHHGLFLG